jgi:hypothetical protein
MRQFQNFFARFSKKNFSQQLAKEEKKFFLLLIFPDFPFFALVHDKRHQIR